MTFKIKSNNSLSCKRHNKSMNIKTKNLVMFFDKDYVYYIYKKIKISSRYNYMQCLI